MTSGRPGRDVIRLKSAETITRGHDQQWLDRISARIPLATHRQVGVRVASERWRNGPCRRCRLAGVRRIGPPSSAAAGSWRHWQTPGTLPSRGRDRSFSSAAKPASESPASLPKLPASSASAAGRGAGRHLCVQHGAPYQPFVEPIASLLSAVASGQPDDRRGGRRPGRPVGADADDRRAHRSAEPLPERQYTPSCSGPHGRHPGRRPDSAGWCWCWRICSGRAIPLCSS